MTDDMTKIAEQLWAIEPRLKITSTGLEFPDDLTVEKWTAIGEVLAAAIDGLALDAQT
jgi:hypothetical protein